MRLLKHMFCSLTQKGQRNYLKVIALAIGLSVGLVLISKVIFEKSFDNFYPDVDRIYQIQTKLKRDDAPAKDYSQVSGGVAVGMRDEIPEVETATRITSIGGYGGESFKVDAEIELSASFILADSCFFDVLPRTMLIGNAKEILSSPMSVMISESISKKIGIDVINRTIILDQYPERELTIKGVFEDVPHNSHARYDIVVSIESIGKFMGDGSDNWLGNDRYRAYVKLRPNVNPENLTSAIYEMQVRHQPMDRFKEEGTEFSYWLLNLEKLYSDNSSTNRSTLLLTLLAVILILVSVLNYVLMTTSTLMRRTKEIALHKCHGAVQSDVTKLVYAETFGHLLASLLLAFILIFIFDGVVEQALGTSVSILFNAHSCIYLVGICFLIFLLTGIIPAYLYNRVSALSVLRNMKLSYRSWKLVLLFFQFTSVAFLVTLLAIIGQQYSTMINDNPGYTYDKLAYTNLGGIHPKVRYRIMSKLKVSPAVEDVTTAIDLPFMGLSGDNVKESQESKELFNIADLFYVSPNFHEMFDIKVLEGEAFKEGVSTEHDIMVSEDFVEKLGVFIDVSDGLIGKQIYVTCLGLCTVRGVYSKIRLGAITNEDHRASVVACAAYPMELLIVKLREMNGENIQVVHDIIKAEVESYPVHLNIYADEMIDLYKDARRFKDIVLLGGIVTLLIAIFGLIGYTQNEVNSRSKEIAIRKINGATLNDIIRLLARNIFYLSLPAIIAGEVLAYITADKWMENFSERVAISPLLFIGSASTVLAIILTVTVAHVRYVANTNPVDSLKSE